MLFNSLLGNCSETDGFLRNCMEIGMLIKPHSALSTAL